MVQAIIFLVGVLGGTSLLFGVVIALVVVIWAQDVDTALRFIVNGYYLLVGVMPVALWFALLTAHDEVEYQAGYDSPLRAILTTVQGAIVGSILGAGPIFLAVVITLPLLLADFEVGELGTAAYDAIVWSRLALAVGAAVASAIPLGLWVYYTSAQWRDD
jgi:hypothetical protein